MATKFVVWEVTGLVGALFLVVTQGQIAGGWRKSWRGKEDHSFGILQARILEWVAFPFFGGSSQPRDRTQVSCICGWIPYQLSHKEAPESWIG